MNNIFNVEGMTCIICKNTVEKTLLEINGVKDARVNLLDNEVYIEYDNVSFDILEKAVKNAGYKLSIKKKNNNHSLIKIIISLLLSIILMILMKINGIVIYQILLTLIVFILNINTLKNGFFSLFKLNPNMNSLVTISSITSFILSIINVLVIKKQHSYFDTSAMILSITAVGKYIEKGTKSKATSILRGLTTLIPMQANLKRDNGDIEIIPISELKKGNIVVIKNGESVPQDGLILKGQAQLDESMITGESIPVYKTINNTVIGGSIIVDGILEVEITSSTNTTILSNIVNQTKKSLTSKIPIEKTVDRISKYFVYIILLISLTTFIVWYLASKDMELSINFALSVMVISCPCALGLATPSAIYVANSIAAKNGILIKNPSIIEILHKTKYMIFDKTGTLTENKLHIIKEEIYNNDFINIICSLESISNHPIAKSIIANYKYTHIQFDNLEEIKGKGIKGILNGSIYYVGNIDFLKEKGIIINNDIKDNSLIIGAIKDRELLGLIHLNDVLRESSIKALNELKNKDITLILCTGDSDESAKKINNKFLFNETYSNVKPENKSDIVSSYKQKGIITMIGDGINDAIALSNANISISIKEASDIANASSDIILLNNDINDINFLYNLSKKTIKIIKQNLFWALIYNSFFIPLAAGLLYNKFGIALTPIIGTITMSISSIIVITNALRIGKIQKEK